jgi:hypothetical protein
MSNIKLRFRRDSSTVWTSVNPVLDEGELGIELNTGLFKLGDGIKTWSELPYGGIQGPAGSTTTHTGVATIDFGATPGTSVTTVTVSDQTEILSTTPVRLEIMGNDSTADHNAYEHSVVPITLRCTSIAVGSNFIITASSDWRLTGTFKVRWTWLS